MYLQYLKKIKNEFIPVNTMEIAVIKQNLPLANVLQYYNLRPNKNNMLNCPFHEDNTASLQVNPTQNKYKCHACDKKGDVIQFVQDYEKLTKHEAILKCVSMINPNVTTIAVIENKKTTEIVQTDFLEKMFSSFRNGLNSSNPAKDYCKHRNLDTTKLEIGFNSGQFHHGERKSEKLINNCLAVGLLLDRGLISKTGEKAYNVFGNKSIVFPLKNKTNQVVSLYFRSTINEKESKHFYLKNRQGLYPNYPKKETKKLILTESIIDCASLLQITETVEN
jgi:DNA primase